MLKLNENTHETILKIKELNHEINAMCNTGIEKTEMDEDIERRILREIRDSNIETAKIIMEIGMRGLI